MSRDLTPAQSAVWFAQQQVGDAPVYQCAERVDIRGDFDAARFARVLTGCLRRLPALNADYRDEGDGPRAVPDPRPHEVVVHRLANTRIESDGVESDGVESDGVESDGVESAGALEPIIAAALTPSHPGPGISGDRLSAQQLIAVSADHHIWIPRIHHIAVDGYSFAQLLRWVADSYTADLTGQPQPAPPFAPPGAATAGTDAPGPLPDEADAAFWHRYTEPDRPASLSPAEPAPATTRAHRTGIRLDPPAAPARRGWAESTIAALAGYVAAWSGETTVTLGVPWANRTLGAPSTLEPTVNILPLRLSVSPAMTVDQLVGAVTRELDAVRPHTRYRAEQLRRDLGVVGSGTPLFGPGANLKYFTPQLTFGPATGTVTNLAMGPVDDLTVTGSPQDDGGFLLEVEAAPGRYTAADTRHHARRLGALVRRFHEDDGSSPLGALPIAGPDEVHSEIIERNRTAEPELLALAEGTTLTELLHRAAHRHADRPALRRADGTGALTYRQLHEAAAELAAALRTRGVGRGDVVALVLERSPELVCAMLATLTCGAAYLPIDPALPEARIGSMLDDAGARVVLTSPDAAASPDAGAAPDPSTAPDRNRSDWRSGDLRLHVSARRPGAPAAAAGPPSPADAAYLIFTSGSTGRPKGVVVEHRAIVNRLGWMDRTFRLTPGDRVLQKTPASFDVSVWEFFWPLITGAQLVLATGGIERDSPALAAELTRNAVTVCHFVPSAFAALLAAIGENRDADVVAPRLRLVICSGEALPAPELARGRRLLAGAAIHNLYGPTEAAVDVTAWSPGPDWDAAQVPIGSPIANTACYVLDSALRPQPAGAVGQLYLSGIQLARGYTARPGLTAERFLADPFAAGARMYATGDLVHRDTDGRLIYDGRIDHQVKVRGRRIELGEIETALARLPGVDRAAVLTREVETGTGPATLIVGYAVPDDAAPKYTVPEGAGLAPDRLREQLARELPSYLVPDAIVLLDALPVTRNGKLDRRALPAPRLGSDTVIAPDSVTEAALEPLFAAALGRDRISVHDSFFDLGGTSLSAAVLAGRCAAALGVPVGVADLFAAPSVGALARRLDGDRSIDPFGRLLTLRATPAGSGRAPVFAIHPAGGLGWCYVGLLPELHPDTGLYALQADGLTGGDLPASLSEVADAYLEAIEAVAPDGPIRLLGWSVGGVIAHQLAVTAAARGREVRQTVLLDAYPSESWRDRPPASPAEIRRALLIMAGADTADALDSDDDVLAALRGTRTPLGSLSTEQVARISRVVAHFAELMRTHRTRVLDGDVWHVAAAASTEDFLDPAAWAAAVTGTVHRTALPVTHPGMVAPESLAAIAALLDGSVSTPAAATRAPTDAERLRAAIVDGEPGPEAPAVIAALDAHGTPLLTDDPDDPGRQRLLLTHLTEPDVAGVYLWANRLTDGARQDRGQLRRWGGTDLWFTEFPITRDTMASYRIYPYRAGDSALRDGRLHYSRAVAAAAIVDPTARDAAQLPFGSVLRGSAAPTLARWRRRDPDSDPGPVLLDSGTLPGTGLRWRLTAPIGAADAPVRIAVIPEANLWFDRRDLPGVLARTHPGAPVALLGIDAPVEPAARIAQLGANREVISAIADLVPRARRILGDGAAPAVWTGQSLGGLTALAAAAWCGEAVDELIVYSPSLWWRPGRTARPADWTGEPSWITGELTTAPPRPLRLAVGDFEDLLVGPVAELGRELTGRGWPVTVRQYAGGHDAAWWAELLLDDLA